MKYENTEYTQIPGFEDYFIAKSTGQVISTKKRANALEGSIFKLKAQQNSTTSNSTYYMVRLTNNEGKYIKKYIHRLLAELFVDNPNNNPQVNHIDGNKHNNNIDNLEWVTVAENTQHAYDNGLYSSKAIQQFTKDGELVNTFEYTVKASKATGIPDSNITKVLKGKRQSAGGFIWKYVN